MKEPFESSVPGTNIEESSSQPLDGAEKETVLEHSPLIDNTSDQTLPSDTGWQLLSVDMQNVSTLSFYQKILNRLPGPLQSLWTALLLRAQNLNPEGDIRKVPFAAHSRLWFSILTLINAIGMFSIAYAFTISRKGEDGFELFFFLGLFLIFFPTMVRFVLPYASRWERIGLSCVVGMSCYLVKIMTSPQYFSFFDEFLHWRTADTILATGHLFGSNTMLPVSPYYPGLEIVTNALSTLGGISTFQSASIVVGVARLLMVLAFFLLNEQLFLSHRAASIASIIYMTNPHFLLFDAQYGYESLALPLAIFALFAMAPHQKVSVRLMSLHLHSPIAGLLEGISKDLNKDLRWITITVGITLVAVCVTHHVTMFFLAGTLILWTFIYAYMRLTPLWKAHLTRIALFACILAIGWTILPGNPVLAYLSSFITAAITELSHIIMGGGGTKQLFVSYAGQPTPLWERLITIVSVFIIVGCLPFGLLCLQQRYRSSALTRTFVVVAITYPLIQVFRFTDTGSELTDRAAAFLFLPISMALAIFITQFWPTLRLKWVQTTMISVVMLIVCLGGVVLGTGPSSALLPGPYEVTADSRSIEPEGIQAAVWARTYLGSNNRVATDRINQILMGTYGEQTIITSIQENLDVSPLFLAPDLDNYGLWILRDTKTRYLVSDLRLSRSLPLLGYYYEASEEGAFHHTTPVNVKNLTKFDTIAHVNRVFDCGDLVIYDVGGLW